MPVLYEIEKTKELIRTRCTGQVTLPDVVEHFRTLERDPDCPNRLDALLDLTETTTLPSSQQLKAVSEEIGRIRSRVRFGACAMVVRTDAFAGTAMVFEVAAARSFRVTRIFREVEAAEEWLRRNV